MEKNKTVTINGQRYDAHTGLPLDFAIAPTPTTKPLAAAGIHGALQKSQTLVRRVTKKPTMSPTGRPAKLLGRTMDIARSGKISRFAPHPTAQPAQKTVAAPDIPATAHPVVSKANAVHAAKKTPVATQTPKSSRDIKQEAIAAALAKPAVKTSKKSFLKRHPRFISILSASIFIALVGTYAIYVNMPGLSVRVAASQAGIEATYPEYRPDGYRLDGPVSYSDGQVTINFVANTGTSTFTIKQSKSSWDSSAVLENIVRKNAGEKYITSQERGLTIYTYNGNAAWVNAGILYVIDGNAPLSGEQIRHIATSL